MTTKEFLDRVNELLDEKGWSRNRLASEGNIPKSTIYNMLDRQNEPKLETFIRIIDAFQISADEFLHPESTKAIPTIAQRELLNITKQCSPKQMDRIIGYA